MRLGSFDKYQLVLVLVLGLTLFFVGLFRPYHPFRSILGLPGSSNLTVKHSRQSFIEVAGAVKNPGIFTFDKLPTANQAIQRADGPISTHYHPLNTPCNTLETGMRVELTNANTEHAQTIITPMSFRKRLVLGIPVEINQAHVDDFAMIPGISRNLARRIVEFRESHGPFNTWNDLRRVNGIGPRKAERIQLYLSLTRPTRN